MFAVCDDVEALAGEWPLGGIARHNTHSVGSTQKKKKEPKINYKAPRFKSRCKQYMPPNPKTAQARIMDAFAANGASG